MIEELLTLENTVTAVFSIVSFYLIYDYLKIKFDIDVVETAKGWDVMGKIKIKKGTEEDESDGDDK